jgi:hypothetical protein
LYTGDNAALESDAVFIEFITGGHYEFVVEDADHLLSSRANGNRTLHRFLNIADGLARAQGRKIILSTNLPNLRDIDAALVRPGRCFAHVVIRDMKTTDANDRSMRCSELKEVGAS